MQLLTKWLNRLAVIASLLFSLSAKAQNSASLTLVQAYDMAEKNYPVIKQKDLIKQTAAISIDNLNKGYLPQVSFSGQATYQSDVTKLGFTLPGFDFKPLSKDQYKALADVDQVVYDGGMIKQQKISQQLNQVVEEQKVEVELYKLKDRINQVFLAVLFLNYQLQQTELVKNDLQTGIKKVEAQVNNGLVLRSNLNVLKAELLKADQRSIELRSSRNGMLQTLAVFINQSLDETTVLEKPSSPALADNSISRPELKLFNYQSQQLGQQTKLIQSKNLPKTSLFMQGGYGKPGLNFLKNDFTFYYIGGVRVYWPLSGLYTQKKEKELVKINQQIVDIQKETFLLNTNTQLTQQNSEIEKLNKLVESDKEIIDLRVQVKDAAKAQLENAVITANDYLREVNAEDQARQVLITHQVQLLLAQINYQTTLGKQ
jgi:outer membrane protein TolC